LDQPKKNRLEKQYLKKLFKKSIFFLIVRTPSYYTYLESARREDSEYIYIFRIGAVFPELRGGGKLKGQEKKRGVS